MLERQLTTIAYSWTFGYRYAKQDRFKTARGIGGRSPPTRIEAARSAAIDSSTSREVENIVIMYFFGVGVFMSFGKEQKVKAVLFGCEHCSFSI